MHERQSVIELELTDSGFAGDIMTSDSDGYEVESARVDYCRGRELHGFENCRC